MAAKKNILIITVRADYGGGPEHIFRLLPYLHEKYNVFIACPDDEPYFKRFSDIVGAKNLFKIPHRKFSPVIYLRLLLFIWAKNIYVVHSHGKGAGIYSRLFKFFTFTRVFHTFHGLHTGEYSGFQKFMYISLERFFSLITEICISVSDSEKKSLTRENICPGDNLVVIKNGVNIPEVKNSFPVKTPYRILHISRFDYAKNPELLLDIATQLQEIGLYGKIVFDIIGDGEGREAIKKEAKSSGIAGLFNFIGFKNELAPYYKSAFIYLSTSRWEGLPLSVLESKSYGIPPVLSNVTGNSDLVANGKTGFLYELDSPFQAARFIKKLIENRELWDELSTASRDEVAEKYSLEQSAKQLLDLYGKNRG